MKYKFRKEIYPQEAIVKASYFFAEDYYISLDADKEYFVVNMEPKDESKSTDLEKEFQNEVLAQTNRYMISSKTKNIRELIIGRALASTMIDTRDEGFVDDDDISADEILVNWFEKNE